MHRLLIQDIVCACASLDRRTDALRHASSLANATGARLHVLQVRGDMAMRALDSAPPLEADDKSVEPPARTAVAHGKPGSGIAGYAVRTAAQLVVIGDGRNARHTMSIVGEVVRHARCPVLVVPTGLPTKKRSGGYDEIVCAVSSGLSTSTLHCALAFAQEFQARLTLVNVDSPALWSPWHQGRAVLEDDMERLRSHIPETAHAWCDIDELVCHGDPATEVEAVAERVNADLVVVGTSACDDWHLGIGRLRLRS
jgi:nucleotide-binding universal stress UspA family protein